MPDEIMIEVGYNGSKYKVPADVVRSNMAASWIEDQIAEQSQRQARRKAQKQQSTEAEFTTIKNKLKLIDRLSDRVEQQDEAIEAYASANAALKAQVAALEESGGVLGGANAMARQSAFDLANASTTAQNTLSELNRVDSNWNRQIDLMEERLERMQSQMQAQIDTANRAAATRERLAQERVNRLLDDVSRAEARAAKAEAVAAQAMADAEAAGVLGNGRLTRQDITNAVTAELDAQTPAMVDRAIETIKRDEFVGGSMLGQRMDGDLIRRQRSDAENFMEGRQ